MKPLTFKNLKFAARGLKWWTDELRASLQELLSFIAPKWRRTLTAFVSPSRLLIVEDPATEAPPILELPRARCDAHMSSPLPADHALAGLEPGRRVRLVFEPEFAFVRTLSFPIAVLPHLRSALDLQIPKLLPLSVALLRWDFALTGPSPDGASIDVELAAIKRSDVDSIEQPLRSWGLRPTSVQLGRPSDPSFRFRFGAPDAPASRFALSRADSLLAASAATLTMAMIIVFAVQSYRAQKSLDQALAQATDAATSVLQQRQQLISRLELLSVVSSVERTPGAAAVLSDVTRRISHDTWLTTFELKGRDLKLVGQSADPATLVKQLASSQVIAEIELKSSLSTAAGRDRFEITAQVRAGP
jgi:Fimbrial assembly protein (PilN)